VRKRRNPDDARALILQAAERVLGEKGPDRATLRDVAQTAGVSHALVTHYFKTYDALVQAVFDARLMGIWNFATSFQASNTERPPIHELLRAVLRLMSEPIHRRLATWASMDDQGTEFHRARTQWFREQASLLEKHTGLPADDKSDGLLLLSIAALFGFSIGGQGFSLGLGLERAQGEELFLEALARAVEAETRRHKRARIKSITP
jgi:TetR/AcrR family transcriptional regulator, repressor for neighboring sulfatase